jgi:hypothetical protein
MPAPKLHRNVVALGFLGLLLLRPEKYETIR